MYAAIEAYDDLVAWDGDGIYMNKTGSSLGGHAIEIIGWCDKDSRSQYNRTGGYWICRNSWGTLWAPKFTYPGYFAIAMGQNECGIESRAGGALCDVKEQSIVNVFTKLSDFLQVNGL